MFKTIVFYGLGFIVCHLAPVSLARGAGRSHLCLLLAFLQLLSGQDNFTAVITATWAIPETVTKIMSITKLC